MSATQDFVALEWIRGELSATLESAQVALEAVAESSDDTASMRSCLSAIHQVHGTLKMVQLDGPTIMAAEMEEVAQALMDNEVPDVQLALETLMQSILQLPVYLDRLHKEQKDSERNYLPMVNNLRASRGEERMAGSEPEESEEDSGPDLSPLTATPSDDVINAYFQADGEGNLPKISARYRVTLAAILKKKDVKENLTTLAKLFNMLDRLCGESPMGNLAELGLAVVEGIASGAIKLDNASATQLRNIDGAIKALADAGQDGLSHPVESETALGLIALINDATKETKRITVLREKYASQQREPEEVAIGPDDDTMSAVAKIIVEELAAVTDKLDLYVRSQSRNVDDLVALLPNLEQIASTLVILGNMDQQATVLEQIAVIKGVGDNGDPDDDTLLTMAQALLQIEATLGALVQDDDESGDADSFANLNDAHAAVVKETRTGLAKAKDKVIEFTTANYDHSKLENLVEDLQALRGGLLIVGQNRAGDVLTAAAGYVALELVPDKPNPELEQMDDLADALTAVDYYLERLLENAVDPYLQMLEVAEAAVAKLDYPVGKAVELPESEPVAEEDDDEEAALAADVEPEEVEVEEAEAEIEEFTAEETEAGIEDVELEEQEEESAEPAVEDAAEFEEIELDIEEEPVADEAETEAEAEPVAEEVEPEAEEELAEEATETAPEASAADASPVADVIDEEILEIFVDEAEEVLENIGEFLPQWQQNPADHEALTEVRRAFHTLKGSGRMVGATVVGELAWSVENLLNRVMDKSIPATTEIQSLVAEVVGRIPEGVEAFKSGNQNAFNADELAAAADALAEGGAAPAAAEEVAEAEMPDAPEEDFTLEAVDETEEQAAEADVPVLEDEIVEEEVAADEDSFELDTVEEETDSFELETVEEEVDEETESFELETLEEEVDEETESFELETVEEETDSFELETVEEDVAEDAGTVELETVEQDVVTASEEMAEDEELGLEEIFSAEAEEKLADIEQFLASGEVSSALVAAFHTLKGSSAMAEIHSISTIAAPMEHLTNDYLIQNKPADDELKALCRDAVALIRVVLADIDGNREQVAGGDELIDRITGDGAEEEAVTPAVGFDFSSIVLLSDENIASDGWQQVEALVGEMEAADEQARQLGQEALSALLTAMLRIYRESPGKPDELTLSLMKRAHDHLLFMFDALASSQRIRPADNVVAELNAVEISAAEPAAETESEVEIEEVEVAADEAEAAEAEELPVVEDAAAEVEQPAADTSQAPAAAMVELPDDDIDEDILPIFLEESEELLEEIDQSIQGWVESGSPEGHLDGLLRQLHTLKGGSRMAGLASLGEFTHNFESFLIGVQTNPVDFDDNFFALLHGQQDEIIRRVEIYQNVGAGNASQEELDSMRTGPSPSLTAAPAAAATPASAPEAADEETPAEVADEAPVEETAAVEQSAPAAAAPVGGDKEVELPADEIDEDVLPIFLEESEDLVEELESTIQTWSESPGDLDSLDVLMRNLHTLKGGARMAGLNSLGEYAHNFETFLIGIQQDPPELDDDFFALLSRRQDEVIRRVEIYKQLAIGAASEEDLESLKKAIEPSLETEPVESPEAAAEAAEAAAEDAGEAPAAAPAAAKAEKKDKAASANQEMVRVAADLLEELISMAGESSITRGRVEQQIVDFGDALQEMEETISRIRDQVRRLEIEAESRETLIRSRQGEDGDSGFDDLEMDRYTMLQAISRALNEATSDMMDLKDTLGNKSRDAETLLIQQARLNGELQEGLTRTRMVPFARLIPRLRRIVRQVSGEVGKAVRFDAYNVEGELDRSVLERIVAPLEHMLRNAVDHGIEDKDKRVAAGKAEQGRISLRLSREGGYFVLTLSDDGGGINVDAVRKKAIERGLIAEGQDVSDHEVMQFIMHAGFSTAQKLTQISGRGVGMDVVGSEIKALGGDVTIDSTLGVGTEFTVRIPFTVSINRALMVVVKEETYAVPLNTIEGIVRVSPYELEAYYQPDAPMFEYAGQPYRLAYIGKMLDNTEDPNLTGQIAPLPVILARSGDHAVALQVDRVIGSREVVVKTLGTQFDEVGGISGATVLGDGSVVIILDCMALVRSYESNRDRPAAPVPEEIVAEPESTVRTVMIVDDSVTVRKVTSRLMERQGYEVATAKDGVDAMHQLQELELRPDVMLLDIEMPRMDGFEVLRSVRRDENLKDLPIIMITSRTGEKHKQQAMELGVNQYLGKPFQEANLLATIDEVIESAKAKT